MHKTMIFALIPLTQLQGELVGHWLFDEGEGTTYADSSPKGNDAIVAEERVWSMDVPGTGFPNEASLDLSRDLVYVSTGYAGLGGDAPRTVAFWMKGTAIGTNGIVAWGNSTVNGAKWHLRLNDNAANGPLGAIRTETQGDFTIGSTALNDGEWHHVVSVYPEGGGELGTVIHYVDGVAETPGGNNGSTQAVNTSTTADEVTIGRRTQGTVQGYFPGQLDDVRIYDRALSGAEVAALTGANPTTEGLVLHYAMEEGSGTSFTDRGEGGNDGTLIIPPLPTWSDDAPAHLSSSLLFANDNDLLLTDSEGIGGTASRTVTFWFKTTSVVDNGILGWGDAGGNGLKWHTRLNSGAADGPVGALRLEIQGGRIVATTPVADGQWHHGAIVFEEDANPDISDVVFYLDGAIDEASLFTPVPINTVNSGGAFSVTLGGRLQGNEPRGWDGNLADLRIYDTALSQEEVMTVMAGAAGGGGGLVITSLDYTPGDPGSATLTWRSRPGRFYRVEFNSDLRTNWLEATDAWESQGETTSFTFNGVAAGTPRLFFRVAEE